MDTAVLNQRIEDLEARYAFQEDQIRQLDDVIREQAKQIDELIRDLKELREHVLSHGPGDPGPEDQVPPHY